MSPQAKTADPQHQFLFQRQFGTWKTSAIRQALKPGDFSYLQNWIIMGAGNQRTVAGPVTTTSIGGTGPDTGQFKAVKAWYVSLTTGDWEIFITASGNLYAISLNDGTVKSFGVIAINDVTSWNASVALLVGPGGYFSWDGSSSALVSISTDMPWTLVLTATSGPDPAPGDTISEISGAWNGTVVSYDNATSTLVLDPVTVVRYAPSGGQPVNLTPSLSFSGIIVTATVTGAPASGNWIAVYAGRVWIANGRSITFSGPLDYTATGFDVANGAGTFFIADTTLKGIITRLVAANGYLYIFGECSIDIVSNVYVPADASPPTPLFTRTNIDSVNGTPFSYSIILFGRLVLFYNVHGVHALSGVQVTRISQDIDTTMQEIDPNPPALVSAGVGVCNNILTASFLLSWFDPTSDSEVARQTLLSFYDGKWFIHDPYTDLDTGANTTTDLLTVITAATINGDPSAVLGRYRGMLDGTLVQRFDTLFQDAAAILNRKAQSAYWELGSSIHTKQSIYYGIELNITEADCFLTVTMDATGPAAENQSPALPIVVPFPWFNSQGQPFSWFNGSGQPFTWVNVGYQFFYSTVSQYGKYLGETIDGLSGQAVISSYNLEYIVRDATWNL